MQRRTLSTEEIRTLAGIARLNLPEERYSLQADTLNSIFQMLDTLDDVCLGETSPASTFQAKWESWIE